MTKKQTCNFLFEEQQKLRDKKRVLIDELIKLDDKLEHINELASHFICEDETPEALKMIRVLAEDCAEELRGSGGGSGGISL